MTHRRTQRAAIYARVSTLEQEPENQLDQLRRYVDARGWTATVMIRHYETGKVPITESDHIDYLFHRMFALVLMILRMRGTSGVNGRTHR